jgi:hypothetical protein
MEKFFDIASMAVRRENPGHVLDGATLGSMNLWGFPPDVFSLLEDGSEKAEHYLPSFVADIITTGQATVRVLHTDSDWFGVTDREDKQLVVESTARLVSRGDYPATL